MHDVANYAAVRSSNFRGLLVGLPSTRRAPERSSYAAVGLSAALMERSGKQEGGGPRDLGDVKAGGKLETGQVDNKPLPCDSGGDGVCAAAFDGRRVYRVSPPAQSLGFFPQRLEQVIGVDLQ